MSDEQKFIDTLLSLGGISALAAASRSIVSEDRRSLVGFSRGLIMAAFVGMMVGFFIQNYNFSPSIEGFIVGISAFVADDILMMVLKTSSVIRSNPKKALYLIVDHVLGGRK